MRRSQYRITIALLAILNILLMMVCLFSIYKLVQLEDRMSNALEEISSIAEVVDSQESSAVAGEQVSAIDQQVVTTAEAVSPYASLMGTWTCNDFIITILEDGSFSYAQMGSGDDRYIFHYRYGYLSDGNTMIVTREYEYLPDNGSADDRTRYYDPSDIPESEWDTEKKAGNTIVQTSSETFSMKSVQGELLRLNFVKQ